MTKIVIDSNKLTPAQQRKMQRILKPRDRMLSLEFADADVTTWQRAAKVANKSLTEWMEDLLNATAAK